MPRPTTFTLQDQDSCGWAAHGWLYFNTDPFNLAHYFARRVADEALRFRLEAIANHDLYLDPPEFDPSEWLTFDLFVDLAHWSVMRKEEERRKVTDEDRMLGTIFHGDRDHWFNAHWDRAHSCRIYNAAIWNERLANNPQLCARWDAYLKGDR